MGRPLANFAVKEVSRKTALRSVTSVTRLFLAVEDPKPGFIWRCDFVFRMDDSGGEDDKDETGFKELTSSLVVKLNLLVVVEDPKPSLVVGCDK